MKRLLIGIITLITSLQASAQCPGCAINLTCTGTVPTLCPATLPSGTQGQPYDQDLTFFLPETFTDAGSGTNVTLQQIVVTGLSGIPAGLSWQSNSANNTYVVTSDPNTQRGCAKVCGTPSLPGQYNVTVSVIATVNTIIGVQSVPQSFTLPLEILPAAGGNPYFSFNPSSGCGSVDVTFDGLLNLGSPQVTEYVWDFGNGNNSNLQNPPVQTYTGAGEYHPTLTTNIYDYVFNAMSASCTGGWWCGDVEEFTCGNNADIKFTLTHGTATYNGAEVGNNSNPSWSNLGVILSNLTIALQFTDVDAVSQSDNGGTFAFIVPGEGVYNFSTTAVSSGGGGLNGNFTITKQLFNALVATDTVRVYDLPPATAITSSTGSFEMCTNDPVVLSVYPGYTYSWFLNDTTLLVGADSSSYVVPDPGNYPTTNNYKVKITDPNTGCAYFTPNVAVTIVEGISDLFPNVGANYFNGQLTSSYSGFASYQWMLNGTPLVPAGQVQTFTPSVNGNYSLIITNALGCTDTSNTVALFNVGIDEVSGLDEFISVYPNPSNGEFTINMSVPVSSGLNVSVIDISGKTIYQENMGQLNGTFNKTFNLQHLSAGVYTLNISFDQGSVRRKLIIR